MAENDTTGETLRHKFISWGKIILLEFLMLIVISYGILGYGVSCYSYWVLLLYGVLVI